MLKIEILFFKKLFHWSSHIEAVITDMDAKPIKSFHVNYPQVTILNNHTYNQDLNSMEAPLPLGNTTAEESIILYCNQDLDTFKLDYYHAHGNYNKYNFLSNNCANAVDFTLDYFFPNHKEILDGIYGIYQGVCCGLSLATLLLTLFPTPPSIASPQDIYNKARMLSSIYGHTPSQKKLPESKPVIAKTCAWLAQHNQTIAQENILLLAILNKEINIYVHFLNKHRDNSFAKNIGYAYLCFIAFGQMSNAKVLLNKFPHYFTKIGTDESVYSYKANATFTNTGLGKLFSSHIQFQQSHIDSDFLNYLCHYNAGTFITYNSGLFYPTTFLTMLYPNQKLLLPLLTTHGHLFSKKELLKIKEKHKDYFSEPLLKMISEITSTEAKPSQARRSF